MRGGWRAAAAAAAAAAPRLHAFTHARTHTHTAQILFERGFTTVLDIQVTSVPSAVCQTTGSVRLESRKVWVLQVTWPKPAVRPESLRL